MQVVQHVLNFQHGIYIDLELFTALKHFVYFPVYIDFFLHVLLKYSYQGYD